MNKIVSVKFGYLVLCIFIASVFSFIIGTARRSEIKPGNISTLVAAKQAGQADLIEYKLPDFQASGLDSEDARHLTITTPNIVGVLSWDKKTDLMTGTVWSRTSGEQLVWIDGTKTNITSHVSRTVQPGEEWNRINEQAGLLWIAYGLEPSTRMHYDGSLATPAFKRRAP
jgi:hypothetical protein